MARIENVVEMLKKDKIYKRLLQSFKEDKLYRIDTKKVIEEIKDIHNLREIRALSPKSPKFIDALVSANTKDQSSRTRLTEIHMTVSLAIKTLENAIDNIKKYYVMEYREYLKQFRTKEERTLVMEIALKTFIKYVGKLYEVKEVVILVIQDIDKAHYSLKLSVDAIKNSMDKEKFL